MGLFTRNEQDKPQRNPDAIFGFRVLAAGYVLYLLYQTVQMYINGEAESSIWLLIASIVVLGGGSVYILISSYISWRKEKAALAEAAAQEAEQTREEQENSEAELED